MDDFLFLPVGWGFMLLHDHLKGTPYTVVTDGGAHPCCFSTAVTTLDLLSVKRRQGTWVWFLSHLDYDHFSIMLSFVDSGAWNPPHLVFLPETYRREKCKQMLGKFYALACILADGLRIARPRYAEIASILRRSVRIGVKQGDRISAGDLTYHILWPPSDETSEMCGRVLDQVMEKVERYCRRLGKDRETVEQLEREFLDVFEGIEPSETLRSEGSMDLGDVLSSAEDRCRSEGFSGHSHVERGWSTERIFINASSRYEDPELKHLYSNVLNLCSIAYRVKANAELSASASLTYTYMHPCNDWSYALVSPVMNLNDMDDLILFPSDLQGGSLEDMLIDYVFEKLLDCNLLVEVAPHHGNESNLILRGLDPAVVYISRCDDGHVPHSWRNLRNLYSYFFPPAARRCKVVCSGHSLLLRLHVFP